MTVAALAIALAFAAGLVSFLSPCVVPLAPPTPATSPDDRARASGRGPTEP